MSRLVLTGGGTAGHVMPHIAMLPYYRKRGWECFYIGGKGIEKEIAKEHKIDFYEIKTGKLRRYFSVENFIDVFRILFGFCQSLILLRKIKPALVFSKGGFVSVPVAYAAWILRIPVVSHESDMTPGLANRLMKPICKLIFCAFPETLPLLKPIEAIEVGIPVREDLCLGTKEKGRLLCGFIPSEQMKTILVMGGSSGAERINKILAGCLSHLIRDYQIVHITGKGKAIQFEHKNYRAFEFLSDGLGDIFALADLVVSRAGANSIFELRHLKKPMLLIPLEIASRGDQVDNAKSFESKGLARVLREKDLTSELLETEIRTILNNLDRPKSDADSPLQIESASEKILRHLDFLLKEKSEFS
jgi:UDP-N-acetylglucosamine--N-acetylmuramyl-(pentapeptide) pyrophosphoryl-undecaprenol N-acetylglucosamine transferase